MVLIYVSYAFVHTIISRQDRSVDIFRYHTDHGVHMYAKTGDWFMYI
jgi:hypothetical protein